MSHVKNPFLEIAAVLGVAGFIALVGWELGNFFSAHPRFPYDSASSLLAPGFMTQKDMEVEPLFKTVNNNCEQEFLAIHSKLDADAVMWCRKHPDCYDPNHRRCL